MVSNIPNPQKNQHHKRNKQRSKHKSHQRNSDRIKSHKQKHKKFNINKDTKRFLLVLAALAVSVFILNELIGQLDPYMAYNLIWIVGLFVLFLLFIGVWLFFVALKGWASRRL